MLLSVAGRKTQKILKIYQGMDCIDLSNLLVYYDYQKFIVLRGQRKRLMGKSKPLIRWKRSLVDKDS